MLLLLGWAPGNNQEIFNLDEMIEAFTIERIGKSGSKFDPDKTRWFNQQYLRMTPVSELADMIMPKLNAAGVNVSKEHAEGICRLMAERAVFIDDLLSGEYLYRAPQTYDQDAVDKKWKKGDSAALMVEWKTVLSTLTEFSSASIESAFKDFITAKGLGMGAVMPLFRIVLTGTLTGPAASEVAALIGKEESVQRIQRAVDHLG
jgi:glutamyl-tRNA synthetase